MLFGFVLITLVIRYAFKKEWDFSIIIAATISYIFHLFLSFNYYYEPFPPIIRIALIVASIHAWNPDRKYIKKWLEVDYNENVDVVKELKQFAVKTQGSYKYNYLNIPVGRAIAFIDGFEGFNQHEIVNLEYLGYNPIRSDDLMELREYGTLVTNKGLFLKHQEKYKTRDPDIKKKEIEYNCHPVYIPFAGLWAVYININKDYALFKFSDGTKEKISLSQYPLDVNVLNEIQHLIETDVTRNLLFENDALKLSEKEIGQADSQIQAAYKSLLEKNTIALGAYQGFLASQTINNDSGSNITKHMKDIQLNRMTTHTGHGEAAEYANATIDKLAGYRVKSTGAGASKSDGAGQGVNAADRVRTNIFTGETQHIQTKYYKDQNNMAREVAKMDYPPGTIFEVPPGEKFAAEKAFKRNGLDYEIIEGKTSYIASTLIQKSGNIPSITINLLDGAIQSTSAASITFIIAYAQSRHFGLTHQEAAKEATTSGLTTLGVGSVLYAGSQQFAKTKLADDLAKKLTETFGRKINVSDVAGYAGTTITVAIVYGPSLADALRGRISPQQLAKNATVGTAGLAGGALGAKAAGTLGSFAGPIGGILGGMAGSYVSKKVLDKYIDDDSAECYELYREEFIDYLYQVKLDQEELDQLIQFTFAQKKFNSQLKDVYKAGRKYTGFERESAQRTYIKEELLEPIFISILQERDSITSDEIDEAYNYGLSLMSETTLQIA